MRRSIRCLNKPAEGDGGSGKVRYGGKPIPIFLQEMISWEYLPWMSMFGHLSLMIDEEFSTEMAYPSPSILSYNPIQQLIRILKREDLRFVLGFS
jgi:hypothetical protein